MTNQEQYELICEKAKKYNRLIGVLDKIRAEIDDWAYGLDLINISKEEKEITRKTLKKVLNIIDKHTKAESEGEE